MLAAPHRRSDRRLGSHNRRSAKLAAGCLYWPWSTDTKYPATVRRQGAAYRVPHKGLRVFIMCPCVIEQQSLSLALLSEAKLTVGDRHGALRSAQEAVATAERQGIKIYLPRSYWALAEALMASEHSQTSAATRALCAAPRRSLPGPRGRRVRSRKGG